MSNRANADDILKLRADIEEKISDLGEKLDRLNDQLEAVETTIELLGIGKFQTAKHDTLQNIPDLTGLTQADAIAELAKANGNRIKATTAKVALLKAGLIKRPKNALSIVYGVLQRHEARFKKIAPGEYQLIEEKTSTPLLAVSNG